MFLVYNYRTDSYYNQLHFTKCKWLQYDAGSQVYSRNIVQPLTFQPKCNWMHYDACPYCLHSTYVDKLGSETKPVYIQLGNKVLARSANFGRASPALPIRSQSANTLFPNCMSCMKTRYNALLQQQGVIVQCYG